MQTRHQNTHNYRTLAVNFIAIQTFKQQPKMFIVIDIQWHKSCNIDCIVKATSTACKLHTQLQQTTQPVKVNTSTSTSWHIKTCLCVFNRNSGNSWWIFTMYTCGTSGNENEYSTKSNKLHPVFSQSLPMIVIYRSSLVISITNCYFTYFNVPGKKTSWLLPVLFYWTGCLQLCRKSSTVCFSNCSKFFYRSSGQKFSTFSQISCQHFIFKTQHI